jgi:hypothetical protein
MSDTSPAQRTLKLLRDTGYHAQVVERWNAYAHIRQDLFGWVDVVAVHPERSGILGVQTTTGDHVSQRLLKAIGNPALISWLLAGGKLEVHGWRKLRGRWSVRTIDVQLSDLAKTNETTPVIGG